MPNFVATRRLTQRANAAASWDEKAPGAACAGASARAPDAAELTSALQSAFSCPSYRPPTLPAAAMEAMRLASKPEVPFGELVKVLERDALLAARVLSIAQSAFYATRSPVASLQQAALRLGMNTLRDLVIEAALKLKVFRVPGYDEVMERLQRHATAAAHVTRAVCRRARVKTDYAFLCGLLHDMGVAACLTTILERPQWRGLPFAALSTAVDAVHADISGHLARVWQLPDVIQRVVGTHHYAVVDGKPEPVNAALIVAEQLCWEAGAGMLPPPEDADPTATVTPEAPMEGIDVNWPGTLEEARGILRLDDAALRAMREEAFQLVNVQRDMEPSRG